MEDKVNKRFHHEQYWNPSPSKCSTCTNVPRWLFWMNNQVVTCCQS